MIGWFKRKMKSRRYHASDYDVIETATGRVVATCPINNYRGIDAPDDAASFIAKALNETQTELPA